MCPTIRLYAQCADDLMKIAKVWYEPMVAILFSKYTKVQCCQYTLASSVCASGSPESAEFPGHL